MLYLVSLILAIAFAVGCKDAIKKHPVPFYLAAAVIAVATAVFPLSRVPGVLGTCLSIFSRATFSTGLWAIVMWIGALPNGSKPMKMLMPIRGELSIIAAIITLGHNISYGKTYFVRLFNSSSGTLALNQRIAAIISCIMILIMVPLTIISFPKIRRKMNPKRWKQIQRLAYVFYACIYYHVMILTYPQAQSGRVSALISVVVYRWVFVVYALFRIRKFLIVRKKLPANKAGDIVISILFLVVTGALVFPGGLVDNGLNSIAYSTSSTVSSETEEEASDEGLSEEAIEGPSEVSEAESSEEVSEEELSSEEVSEEVSSEVSSEVSEESSSESKESSEPATEVSETTSKESSQAAAESSKTAESSASSAAATVSSTPESSEAAVSSEPVSEVVSEAPKSVYKDGSFSGSAYGYDGNVYVTVTISNDKITAISVSTEESDPSYMDSAKSTVVSRIISAQSTNVDGVSGATYSSKAIKQAVNNALASAKN